mgnify:CR=1 FL=1
MAMVNFSADGKQRSGYLALPESGEGPGLLLLHAWWGLNNFIKHTCDQLAAQGFVVFAPDLHHGGIATTIGAAQQLMENRDFPAVQATAEAALTFLRSHPAVRGKMLKAVGFSMGAEFAGILDSSHPGLFDKIVLFYGAVGEDLSQSKARYECHFGEQDEYEEMEYIEQMKADNVEIFMYPDTLHWFVETDREGYFHPESAAQAWERTLDFLHG